MRSSFHRQGAAYIKERLVIFKDERVGGRARVTIDEERVVTRLNRNRVVEILRLVGCENLISQRKEFIFNAFVYFQPV